MRDAFHQDLRLVTDQLVEMTRLAGSAMARATTALLDADISLAESVIAADEQIDHLREQLDEQSVELLARQQPVATDLRVIVTAMRMSTDIERMGDLARHVAKIARLRYPNSAVPADVRDIVLRMGQMAELIVTSCGTIIASRDTAAAALLERDDDAMDDLHRALFARLAGDGWEHGTETTVDITLVGRYYERYADHAVSVARRVIYLVTGQWDAAVDHEEQEDAEAVAGVD